VRYAHEHSAQVTQPINSYRRHAYALAVLACALKVAEFSVNFDLLQRLSVMAVSLTYIGMLYACAHVTA
jgi:hypothetical protein